MKYWLNGSEIEQAMYDKVDMTNVYVSRHIDEDVNIFAVTMYMLDNVIYIQDLFSRIAKAIRDYNYLVLMNKHADDKYERYISDKKTLLLDSITALSRDYIACKLLNVDKIPYRDFLLE